MRCFNVGSGRAGEWSRTLTVRSEKEEAAAKLIEAHARGHAGRLKAHEAEREAADGAPSAADGGLAVITQEGLAVHANKRHQMSRGMEGWSPFARAIGQVFVSFGVPNGVRGLLFELSPLQVEALVTLTLTLTLTLAFTLTQP